MLLVQLGHKVLGGLAVCTVLPQSGSGLAPILRGGSREKR
jgi:hypothetical protein